MLIGLSGWARSGKDTAAEYLMNERGYTRVAFADPLREALYRLDPIIEVMGFPGARLKQMVNLMGWDELKENSADVRGLLQRMGTEVGREMISPTIWVDLAMKEAAKHKLAVITDVRYPNEADAIKKRGGIIWRIERPEVGPANSHASETAMDSYDFDGIIKNDAQIEKLHLYVELLLTEEAAKIEANNK